MPGVWTQPGSRWTSRGTAGPHYLSPMCNVIRTGPAQAAQRRLPGQPQRLRPLFAQLDSSPRPPSSPRRVVADGPFPGGRRAGQRRHCRHLAADLDVYCASVTRAWPRRHTRFLRDLDNKLYNSAMYVTLGEATRIHHVHRKVFLPTYGLSTRSASWNAAERCGRSTRRGTRGDARL